jgi:AraC-like DNA-binding protein
MGASRLVQPVSADPANRESILGLLDRSRLFQDFRQAFVETTGLQVVLQPAGSWRLPHHGSRRENPFCALMAQRSRTCVACLQSHERLWQRAQNGAATLTCAYGLCETAVPVRCGEEILGHLHTGQSFQRPPTPEQFERVRRRLAAAAPDLDVRQARRLWFASSVLDARRWTSLTALLRIFAEHLSLVSRLAAMQAQHAEPPAITRAREFIEANYGERLSLGRVARFVHASPFYFCKLFKRETGANFTDYLARIRIEKARNLLLNPNLRVSEIAFEVGFQSLTHFNRVFKRLLGLAPSAYRRQVPVV